MGTDAHAMVEVKTDEGWEMCTLPLFPQPETWRKTGRSPLGPNPEIERKYGLFSLLADVVNRTGRMGVTIIHHDIPDHGPIDIEYDMDDGGHEPIVPISEPRGIPLDADPAWQMFARQDGIHSATWFTLDELDDQHPMWDQVLHEDGVVVEAEYLKYKETGELPGQIARQVGGPGLRIVTEEEYDAGERGEGQTAVHIRWTGQTIREEAGRAWWATLAAMRLVAPDDDKTRVRLLIAFDS
jgi:hypothetical protein